MRPTKTMPATHLKPAPAPTSAAEYALLEARILRAMADASTLGEASFSALALNVHAFQRRWNTPYARYCESLAPADRPRTWRDIPAAPQQAFKRFSLRTFSAQETTRTFRTSGTTGETRGSHHFRSLRLYEASILHGWRWLRLPEALPQLVLAPAPSDAPESSLAHMLGVLRAVALRGEQHFCLAADGALDTARVVERLAAWTAAGQPVFVLGTALAFLHLFDRLAASGDRFILPAGSQAMETGGYKGIGLTLTKSELYARFEERLGLPAAAIVNEYGMTELSSPFYTRGLGQAHQGPPWTRVLIVDPATNAEVAPGATGLVRIFDLANLGSVLAIQTQDLAVRREGGAFELLGRDPAALPRGCSRSADELLSATAPKKQQPRRRRKVDRVVPNAMGAKGGESRPDIEGAGAPLALPSR
jgi:hypothetical protein